MGPRSAAQQDHSVETPTLNGAQFRVTTALFSELADDGEPESCAAGRSVGCPPEAVEGAVTRHIVETGSPVDDVDLRTRLGWVDADLHG